MNAGENRFYRSVNVGLRSSVSEEADKRGDCGRGSPFRGDALVGQLRLQRVHLAVQAGHRGLRLQQLLFQPLVLLSEQEASATLPRNGPAVARLTSVSSLIFLFSAGLSSFTVMLLYFSSI